MAEPSYDIHNLLVIGLPFAAYFLGIVIRKVTLPGKDAPPLTHQLLLGIPIALVVVPPFLPALTAVNTDPTKFLMTSGLIIEHGMLLNETAVKRLRDLRDKMRTPDDPAAPPALPSPDLTGVQ